MTPHPLKRVLLDRGITQQELAVSIGCSLSLVGAVVTKQVPASPGFRARCVEELGLPEALLFDEDSITANEPTVPSRAPALCRTEGCERPVEGGGLCHACSAHQRRTGGTKRTRPIARSAPRTGTWIDKYEVDPETGCWLWQASIGSHGYGNIAVDGSNRLAHRVVYSDLIGPIPDDLDLHHECRTRPCVNPAHLTPLTKAEHNAVHARAALGDTPPREPRTTDRPSQESLDRLAQRERKEPTIRTLNTGPDVLIEDERGDAAVSTEPSYSVPMTATGAAAVEPPQPSPTDETCHHGRPFDLCAICSARIPYERPPQPETPATEEPTARAALVDSFDPEVFVDQYEVVNWVLSELPLVLEAAREAGRAQLVHRALINGVGNDVWRLVPSGAEPTPPCSPETERDK